MLSYLPEPSWLNGPPNEPSPCGKCTHCFADLYLNSEGDLDTTPCSCGAALCCAECSRCSKCGDQVCAQCSVNTAASDGKELVCSGCHQTYLDELEDGDTIQPSKKVPLGNAHVHPAIASILNTFAAGLRGQLGGRS